MSVGLIQRVTRPFSSDLNTLKPRRAPLASTASDAHTAGEIDVIRKSSIRIGGTSAVPGLS